MTVIVYRDGVMAADTADWIGNIAYTFDVEKVIRLSDGSLLGAAGDAGDIQAFHRWASEGFLPVEPKDKAQDAFSAMIVRPDGTIWSYDKTWRPERVFGDWYGCGAHVEFINGLMVAGIDAIGAVELAIKHCAFAAGRVYALKLQDAPAEEEIAPEEADEVLDDIYIDDPDHDPVGPRRDPFLVERGLE
jgi:hypothetical protein